MTKIFEYVYPEVYKASALFGYHGIIKIYKDRFVYAYNVLDKANTVSCDWFNMSGAHILHEDFKGFDCKIPSLWIQVPNKDLVIVGEKTAIDFARSEVIESDAYSAELFVQQLRPHNEDAYRVGDYIIKNPTACIYECYDHQSGACLWKQRLNGYLYHEIMIVDNMLIICTAEHGGGVYLIDPKTGEMKGHIDTKGTCEIYIVGDKLYTYVLGNVGQIICASLSTGKIISGADIHRTTMDSPLLVQDNLIITLSFSCIRKKPTLEYVPVITGFRDLCGLV